MEITQILLVVVVLILTAILSIVGFEVFLILGEFRQSVRKMNKILDEAGIISESVAKSVSSLSDLTVGLRSLGEFIKIFIGEKRSETKKLEEGKEEETSSGSSARRFFLRAGKKLS